MAVPSALRARNPRAAAHSVAWVLAVCAVVLGACALLGPRTLTHGIDAVAGPVAVGTVLTAAVFALVPPDRLDRWAAFTVLAVVGVAALCGLFVVVGSAWAGAQAFLALAVLYAGFHLRWASVALVTATALAVDAVMLIGPGSVADAATQLLFSGLTLIVMAALLVRSGNAQERLVAELEQQARVDALTGLVTRRAFDDRLSQLLTARAAGEAVALLLVDVDEFKRINDSFGHPVGDAALVHLAAVLRGRVRGDDAVLCRMGGDELAVLLPGCSAAVASARAHDLLEAVRSTPMRLPDSSLMRLSVSIGVAQAEADAVDRRGLYTAADTALYEAKRDGRDRVTVAGA